MNTLTRTLIFTSLILAAVNVVHAKEGGDQYPNGAETFMSGALPPPGSYFVNYTGYYSGTLHDPNGNEINPIKVSAMWNTLRYVRVTDQNILGGNLVFHGIIPIVKQNIETFGIDNKATGIADITIAPAIAWHTPNYHIVSGLDILLPTGKYDKNNPFKSIGTNNYSYEPFVAATILTKQGWDFSLKLMYSFHGENDHTNYTSGDEFHLDYGINKKIGDWSYGIGGYYLTQLENDKKNGVTLGNTKTKVLGIGPQAKFEHKGMQFIFKWQRETSVENRFGGDKLWFKFITRI